MMFVAPFSLMVPEKSRLYDFPFSVLYGALFGVFAFLLVAILGAVALNLPLRIVVDIHAFDFAVPCALSGAAVAAVMSLMRKLSNLRKLSQLASPY